VGPHIRGGRTKYKSSRWCEINILYSPDTTHCLPPLQVGLETHENLTVGGRRETGFECCCGWALVSQARQSYRRPGRLFRSLRDLGADSISIAALVPRWPIFEQVPISAGEASRSNHSWREVSLPSSSSYGTTCFFLSFFHCLSLSLSLSLVLASFTRCMPLLPSYACGASKYLYVGFS